MSHTCTITINAKGQRCGKPAVKVFRSALNSDEILGECVEHHFDFEPYGRNVGDLVEIHRYGRVYTGQIVRVTPTRVFAQFTYNNGATRVVEV